MRIAIGLGVGALVIGVVGAGIGIAGLATAGDANEKADAIVSARATARQVACEADNDNAERINGLNDRTQNLLRDAVAGNTDRTPEEQAEVDAFLADQVAKYEALKIPLRDCSPAGIAAYYEGKSP